MLPAYGRRRGRDVDRPTKNLWVIEAYEDQAGGQVSTDDCENRRQHYEHQVDDDAGELDLYGEDHDGGFGTNEDD